jgi:hypothetical protein
VGVEDTYEHASGITKPLSQCVYKENSHLIGLLGCLWGVLLPHCACAPTDSKLWKALASLVFSTRSADRLWLAAIKRCTDKKNEQYDKGEKANHSEGKKNKSGFFNSIFGGSNVSTKSTSAGEVYAYVY